MHVRSLLLVGLVGSLGLCACGDDAVAGGGDAGAEPGVDGGARTDADVAGDAGADPGVDAATDPTLVEVSHEREMRGAWVATVWNINWPSSAGLDAATQRAELVSILDTMQSLRLNAVFFQVRAEGDAFYRSELEPWSRFLTGTQGGDPGWDPLAFLVEEAHARGIEAHAWLNPYRAKASRSSTAAWPHASLSLADHVHAYGDYLWMDPGAAEVREHCVEVVMDIVRRYDVDGIHFDDYFYPYPDGSEFPDDATYDAYLASGGTMDRGDWRRDNVNRLVEQLAADIAAENPHVSFGISPFGIYRPGMPEGISGLDQYAAIYADPLRWMQEGWLDYVAPQLYWPTTQTAQAYGALLEWWTTAVDTGHYVYAGNFLDKLGTEPKWSVEEFRAEMDLSREHRDQGSLGNVFFTVKTFQQNREGIADLFRDTYYAEPALTPPVFDLRDRAVAPPTVTVDGITASPSHPDRAELRWWVVYREAGAGFEIDRIVPATRGSIELVPGTWAITAAGLHGVESPGRLVEIH